MSKHDADAVFDMDECPKLKSAAVDELVAVLSVVNIVVPSVAPRRRFAVFGSSNILDAPRFLGDETGEMVVQHAMMESFFIESCSTNLLELMKLMLIVCYLSFSVVFIRQYSFSWFIFNKNLDIKIRLKSNNADFEIHRVRRLFSQNMAVMLTRVGRSYEATRLCVCVSLKFPHNRIKITKIEKENTLKA